MNQIIQFYSILLRNYSTFWIEYFRDNQWWIPHGIGAAEGNVPLIIESKSTLSLTSGSTLPRGANDLLRLRYRIKILTECGQFDYHDLIAEIDLGN